ncbi:MAG: diguanylate cyclase [Rhizobiaceae bacterium]
MDVYFQLLNPLVFLIFSIGFFAIHLTKSSKAALLIAVSYLYAVSAFLFDMIHDSLPLIWGDIWVAGIYAAGTAILAAGIQSHYTGKTRGSILALAVTIHMAVYAYFIIVQDQWMASFSANAGTAIIFAIGLYGVQKHLSTLLDRILIAICLLTIAQNIARPLIIAYMAGGPLTGENYSKDLFLVTLHLSVAVCAVSIAMTLLMIFGREMFHDMRLTSVTDVLTGIRNRRGFETDAAIYFDAEFDKSVCIILADIDHFKTINDTYGHAFGDGVIVEFARLFESHSADSSICARVGGEEFAMVVPDTSLHDAIRLAVLIRTETAKLTIEDGEAMVQFTASFGVAQRNGTEGLISVLSRADEALYSSKMNGRDKVTSEMSLNANLLINKDDNMKRRNNRDRFETAFGKAG